MEINFYYSWDDLTFIYIDIQQNKYFTKMYFFLKVTQNKKLFYLGYLNIAKDIVLKLSIMKILDYTSVSQYIVWSCFIYQKTLAIGNTYVNIYDSMIILNIYIICYMMNIKLNSFYAFL